MFSIPNIPINYKVKINGKISKLYGELIKEVVKVALYREKMKNPRLEVEVLICSENEMIDYNKKYMQKDGVTDIISISYEDNPSSEYVSILGSILICPKEIKRQSDDLEKDYSRHLTHLIVHGTLHLLGYNHEELEERNQMESKEVNILAFLGIESPYLNQ